MKILLDTSYFLPLIKVSVEGIPKNILATLLGENRHQIFYSDVTMFELAAKGLKLAVTGTDITVSDIQAGLDTIQHDPLLNRLAWSDNPPVLEIAKCLREIRPDFIDCLILATAACTVDAFATLDRDLFTAVRKNPVFMEIIKKKNKDFSFWFGDLGRTPLRLMQHNS